MTTDADLTNALTTQKNDIATAISRATDGEELEKAEWMVRFVADMWHALGYGYKVVEMRQRVRDRANHLIAVEREYIAGCRKNCSTRASTLKNIAKLEDLSVKT